MDNLKYEMELDRLRVENEKLKRENAKLKKQNSDSSWQYEVDHKDDWQTIHEMGG